MTQWFRNSRRAVAAEYLGALPNLALAIVGLVVVETTPGTGLSEVLRVAGWLYLAVLVLEPPVGYWGNRFLMTPAALVHDRGIIHKTVRSIPWDSITGFDVDTPWAHRLLGVHKVTIAQAGGEETRVALRGLDPQLVDALRARLADTARPTIADGERPTDPTPSPAGTIVHRAGKGSLAVMSVAHGQIVVVGLALLLSAWELADQLGLTGAVGPLVSDLPLVTRVAVGLVVGLSGGLLITLARYHDFRVESLPDGQLLTSYGWFARRERRFDADAVQGLIVHRNIVELLLGRARLGVLTRDSGARLASNTVIPSAPLATVERVAGEHFGHLSPAPSRVRDDHRAARALGWAVGLVSPAVGLGLAAEWVGLPLWSALLIAASAWLLLSVAAKAAVTQFAWDPSRRAIHVTTQFTHVRETTLRASAVHGLGSTAWRSAPHRLWAAWLGVYAGGPRRYVSLRTPFADLAAVASAIATHRSPLTESTP
ncbi:PH domain-containing protein [Tessaracoccus flavus]|uniref:Uncharacterized protein n=1 Tax=Tessaracoccus flavus TaxID=1610493 RepID=A0A1Q2CHC0_9ACTN|nr:PH domain-containing protein [Tessaracoccus flavus]AQP45518.1 hypothetical protein RPIT_12485 [Tessaracoccus flavus]SDY80270.1 PH domain-containing protein [Tessaracoccus flavus]